MIYKVSSACRRGTYHIAVGLPCQDKLCVYSNAAVTCAALADGAGSRRFSDEGADMVTKLVSREVGRGFDELYEMSGAAVAELLIDKCTEALLGREYDPAEYACTLLFFAGHEDGRFIAGHLGDGVQISVDGKSGEARVFSPPENGSTLNQTFFVTSVTAKERLRIKKGVLEPGGALLMMSDGPAEKLYYHDEGVPAEACRLVVERLASDDGDPDTMLGAVLEHIGETCSDDLSLAVIRWTEEEK